MDNLQYSASITISRRAEELYDMISDVTRMGEWSPVCKECWWDEGEARGLGAWFTGRNETPERTWETRSQVVAAEPAREFSFVVGGTWTRWGYTFSEFEAGTVVTESWEFLPAGLARFEERFGEDAPAQIADRLRSAREGIPQTLAALKRAAESERS
ncbi:MAG: SRPBCC family protein [Acidimicrobiales bacterium]